MLRAGVPSYYQADGLGSITSLSSATGTLANTYTYDSFGNLTASAGSITNPFRYTAREFDAETNLYFYRARYYDPTAGRFTREDPIEFAGGINHYSYVRNSSLNLTDPSGLCPQQKTPCDSPGKAPDPSQYAIKGLGVYLLETSSGTLQAGSGPLTNLAGVLLNLSNLASFHRGGSLDAQAYGSSPAYANYVFGVYMAAAGFSLSESLAAANAYGGMFSNYRWGPNLQPDQTYTHLPAANVANIAAGFNDELHGTLCNPH